MSKAPDWADKAKANTVGKSLGEPSHVVSEPKKAGRKKSKIKRKQALLHLSEFQNEKLNTLELKLKLAGIKISRGRSETVELALALVETMLKTDEVNTLSILSNFVGYEESMLDDDNRT